MKWLDKLKEIINPSIIEYFPGCLTMLKLKDIMNNYITIFNLIGIKVEILDLICCGLPARNAGLKDVTNTLIEKKRNQIKEYNVKYIITSCPSCYAFLNENGFNVKHAVCVIYENLNKLKTKKLNMKASFHDPCHLGRYSNIYNEPRRILEKIGITLIEMEHSKENSLCCGAGGGLINYNRELARKIGIMRVKECKTKALVTCCPLCYLHLKDCVKIANLNINVYEISELILKSLK